MPRPIETASLLEQVAQIARDAGRVIMEVYATDFDVRGKSDASPVTEADERAEAVIIRGLRQLAPQIPIVAEEMVA
ncbi:MAG TPA: inositol monophosphatase family protein, partial [Rubrivivax sp.]|nr:inositol monophosphatase family protein [Rubrivivax sp.]